MNTARQEWMRLLTDAVSEATGLNGVTSVKHAEVILDRISREYGGQRAYVPVVSSKPLPTGKIVKLLLEGLTFAEVARHFKVTERTIHNYVPGGIKGIRSNNLERRA